MSNIVGLLLAAGQGTRFGGDKLLAPLPAASHGVPAFTPIGAAAAMHLVSALPRSIAVVRPQDDALADVLAAAGVSVVRCARAQDGMGASLACGVLSAGDADGWVIALADMPWIAPGTIVAVSRALAAGAEIAAPSCRGVRGHPVGFSGVHRDALEMLTGDEGARALLAVHRERVVLIDVEDEGVLADVDTSTDLHR